MTQLTQAATNAQIIKCNGGFCDLGRSICPDVDLVPLPNVQISARNKQNNQYPDNKPPNLPVTTTAIHNEQFRKRSQERERAVKIAKRVLSDTEMIRLEESGKLLQLRICSQINPFEIRYINPDSVSLAKNEHRQSLAQVSEAESVKDNILITREDWKAYLLGGASMKISNNSKQRNSCSTIDPHKPKQKRFSNVKFHTRGKVSQQHQENHETNKNAETEGFDPTSSSFVPVCGVCFHVYQLLDKTRILLQHDNDSSNHHHHHHHHQASSPDSKRDDVIRQGEIQAAKMSVASKQIWKENIKLKENKKPGKKHKLNGSQVAAVCNKKGENAYITNLILENIAPDISSQCQNEKPNESVSNDATIKNILIALNDKSLGRQVQDILIQNSSFQVQKCDSFREFVTIMNRGSSTSTNNFDTVIVGNYCERSTGSPSSPSINMMEGFRIAKWIRRRERNNLHGSSQTNIASYRSGYLPIIILTSYTSDHDIKSYIDAQIDGCIKLPLQEQNTLLQVTEKAAYIEITEDYFQCRMKYFRDMQKQDMIRRDKEESHDTSKKHTKIKSEKQKRRKPNNMSKINTHDVRKTQKKDSSSKEIKPPGSETDLFSPDTLNSKTGRCNYDKDTCFTYTVMDSAFHFGSPKAPISSQIAASSIKNDSKTFRKSKKTVFNMIVCHDIFDTQERMRILLNPIINRYPGMKILLWNYPGQAFTTFNERQTLNNEFHAKCLYKLINHVGPETKTVYIEEDDDDESESSLNIFDSDHPFFLMGFGNGASIASFFAAKYRPASLRGLISINGFLNVDSHYASIIHDCRNVFQCSPQVRPDIPVYFYARFIFSGKYLKATSAPLALNLYTAVHNPITLQGRIQLCTGTLKNVDVREMLYKVDVPIVIIHGSQNNLVEISHAKCYGDNRSKNSKANASKSCRSIHQALRGCGNKTAVIIVKGAGHELFQENKREMLTLMEQMLIGFHENHDIPLSATMKTTIPSEEQMKFMSTFDETAGSSLSKHVRHISQDKVEDHFINTVIEEENEQRQKQIEKKIVNSWINDKDEIKESILSVTPSETWENYRDNIKTEISLDQPINEKSGSNAKGVRQLTDKKYVKPKKRRAKRSKGKHPSNKIIDPSCPAFERQDNEVYKYGSSMVYPDPKMYPEVKEFMSWRLKRNKKRFTRIQYAALIIQRACRAFIARQLIIRLRCRASAIFIQRCFRGKLGRDVFEEKKKELWAACFTQRVLRGHHGRLKYAQRRRMTEAQIKVAGVWRGRRQRKIVQLLIMKRNEGALIFQCLWRKYSARCFVFRKRIEKYASIVIQRICRGYMGRGLAEKEREKFNFGCSKKKGIDLGRQLLVEHKLHATRLQSEISVLNQERKVLLSQIDAVSGEIDDFEEGVTLLERELYELNLAERDKDVSLSKDAQYELKEQKMRLDQEFSAMLTKISNRKDQLRNLEGKLGSLERERQGKCKDLQVLERKLVVLLEAQQEELKQIKLRQEESFQRKKRRIKGKGSNNGGEVDHGMNTWKGPSNIEKKKAAQLMESTESMMKFGFMSMSMSYFNSMNMVKAMKTIAAQDTIMAAVAEKQNLPKEENIIYKSDNKVEKETISRDSLATSTKGNPTVKLSSSSFSQFPGDTKVQSWSIENVMDWLTTISLSQYRETFREGSIDGAFLYALTDDDLRNTLGVEHKLHRKKILFNIDRLKAYERNELNVDNAVMNESSSSLIERYQDYDHDIRHEMGENNKDQYAPVKNDKAPEIVISNGIQYTDMRRKEASVRSPVPVRSPLPVKTVNSIKEPISDLEPTEPNIVNMKSHISIEDIFSWTRHQKYNKLKKAISNKPDRKFDSLDVRVQFVDGYGTSYLESYERKEGNVGGFHMNSTDEYGNNLLHIAAQNGNIKIGKLLISKGSNPNHQNKLGHTPGHFGVAYQFYDFASWLFDAENGAAANDELENIYGLGPYDGLEV